jgi:hypothetical protein
VSTDEKAGYYIGEIAALIAIVVKELESFVLIHSSHKRTPSGPKVHRSKDQRGNTDACIRRECDIYSMATLVWEAGRMPSIGIILEELMRCVKGGFILGIRTSQTAKRGPGRRIYEARKRSGLLGGFISSF